MTVVLGFIVTQTPVFKEGLNVLTTRFSDVAESEEQSIAVGLISRVFEGFSESVRVFPNAPFFGYGLGIGTNAGAKFLTGQNTFLLAEGEWARLLLESGPVLGLAFIIWRCSVVVWHWIALPEIGEAGQRPASFDFQLSVFTDADRPIWPADDSGFRCFHHRSRFGGAKC